MEWWLTDEDSDPGSLAATVPMRGEQIAQWGWPRDPAEEHLCWESGTAGHGGAWDRATVQWVKGKCWQ